MSKARTVQTFNKSVFTSMDQFEPRRRENGKTTLGTGSFGSVQLNSHLATNELYAIKIIQGSNISTPYEVDGIEREIKVHAKSHHPNIVKLYDSFQENDCVFIVLEYLSNGNLYSYIQKKKKLDEKEACRYFIHTCRALQYLHENNVFHRDIKPENLLLDQNFNLKLCDFGWCAENIHLKRKTFCGTYEYMAPEIVSDIAYDYTIDIWSVGVLLYELLHGYAPFKGKEYKDIAANIKAGQIKFSSSISAEAVQLITMILQKDPQQRPSFQQIFASAFVQKNHTNTQVTKAQTLKVDIVSSPRVSAEVLGVSKYQSPFQHQQPKGRPLENIISTSEKQAVENKTGLVKSPQLLNASKSKLNGQSFETKNKKNSEQPKDAKYCKITIQNSIDDVKKKIDFDSITPLKDKTTSFQNIYTTSPASVFTSKQASILNVQDENSASGTYLRKKNINTTSFFCQSTQNSGAKKAIFNKGSDKKIPKSSILLPNSSIVKNIKTTDSNPKLNLQQSFTSKSLTQITRLNLKSKSGYYGIHDENLLKNDILTNKKISFVTNKNSSRKDHKKTLEQYISLPSENTVTAHEDQFYQNEDQNRAPTMTDRIRLSSDPCRLKNNKESKTDFDRLLKMYMGICKDKRI